MAAAAVEARARAPAEDLRGGLRPAATTRDGGGLGAGEGAAVRRQSARGQRVEFRRRMRLRRRLRAIAARPVAVALALAPAVLLGAGCDSGRPEGSAREGLDVNVGGLDYNV